MPKTECLSDTCSTQSLSIPHFRTGISGLSKNYLIFKINLRPSPKIIRCQDQTGVRFRMAGEIPKIAIGTKFIVYIPVSSDRVCREQNHGTPGAKLVFDFHSSHHKRLNVVWTEGTCQDQKTYKYLFSHRYLLGGYRLRQPVEIR